MSTDSIPFIVLAISAELVGKIGTLPISSSEIIPPVTQNSLMAEFHTP